MAQKDKGQAVPVDKRTRDKVAIVGFTDHRVQALELDRSEWEIWGLNELHRYHSWELFDRWFEVHKREDIEQDEQHIEAMAAMGIPVYMQRHHDDIPNSVAFPRERIMEALDSGYFTSSIAWEVAMALMMGFEEIHVYGVDMAQETEYAEQRNCLEFWLGYARGRGCKVHVPATSDLLKSIGQYGFGVEGDLFTTKLRERLAWLHNQDNDRLKALRSLDSEYNEKRPQFQTRADQLQGAIREVEAAEPSEFRTKRLETLHEEHNKVLSMLRGLDAEYDRKHTAVAAERNQVYGAIQDCNYWLRSWAVPGAASREFTPDRSKDPRTGIAPSADGDAEGVGINPKNRVAQTAA